MADSSPRYGMPQGRARATRMRRMRKLLPILCVFILPVGTLHAQLADETPTPDAPSSDSTTSSVTAVYVPMALPRFPGKTIHVSVGGGPAALIGDFESSFAGMHAALSLGYAVYPELTVLMTADIGRLSLTRGRGMVDPLLYDFQFLRDTDASEAERGVNVLGFDLSARLNFFPHRDYNVFIGLGAGLTFYQADDFSNARIRPAADFPASVTIPLGIGAEWYITRDMALALQLRNAFLLKGDIDAFDPKEIALEYNRRRSTRVDVPSHSGDNIFTFTLGLNYTLFETLDYDEDLLDNAEEFLLGTNPYEIDSDFDGLTDYEEVRVYGTNPLKYDTDDDGLGDYFEIKRYNTDPLKPDTDDDMLTDYEEVMIYNTDPRNPDTDGDMLSDYEEVILYHTDPRNPDTDYDGLDDYAEIHIYGTDPLRPDTDDDGIYDFNEVVTYKTNPLLADTDGDRLLDYDEIAYYGTNPLNPDTDGDGVDDAVELYELRTNPLVKDQSLPPTQRRPFAQQPRYHAELLETRPLPGGGTSYLIAPAVSRHLPREPASIDSVIAALAVIDSSLGAGTRESSADAYARYRRRSIQHIVPAEDAAPRARLLRLDSLHLRQGDILSFCNITFEFDRDELRSEYIPILHEAVQLFHTHPGMKVEIRGHTDADGDELYNQKLSERRARSVQEFLTSQGVETGRLRTVGFGEHQPIAESETEDGRARNRRVEFYIVAIDGRHDDTR